MLNSHFMGEPILARGTNFGNKNWSVGPVLAGFSAKISLAKMILGETNFGVTDPKNDIQNFDVSKIHLRVALHEKSNKMHWCIYNSTICLLKLQKFKYFIQYIILKISKFSTISSD